MRFRAVLAAALVALAGCKDKAAAPRPEKATESKGVRDSDKAPTGKVEIRWLSDDWARAQETALREKKPIFVDLWAPWCHTCLSMKQHVMVDPSLAPYLDRFVWLEIDTDRESSAELLQLIPVDLWPTFYVVSPGKSVSEAPTIQARHIGGASVGQIRDVLDQGEQAHLAFLAKGGKLDPSSPLGMTQMGDAASARGDHAAADQWYGKALAAGGPDWSRTANVLVKQIRARLKGGDMAGCASLGMTENMRAAQGATASVSDFADFAQQCAEALDESRARLLRGRLGEAIRKVLDAPDSAMSVDDQSDALRVLRDLALGLGDETMARENAVRQRDLLDGATARAKTAIERMTYSAPRLEVHIFLDDVEKVIPDLEKLAADLPTEYDPPARLARAYLFTGKHDKALAAAQKAASLAYGPRKTGILKLMVDIHHDRGDQKAEEAARAAVVEYESTLRGGHRVQKTTGEPPGVGEPTPPNDSSPAAKDRAPKKAPVPKKSPPKTLPPKTPSPKTSPPK